jgi:enamine deaminase RidA (YjgF/YER057c/UK114 family)
MVGRGDAPALCHFGPCDTEEEKGMEPRIINPWPWPDQLGFVQANEITGAQRQLICSGLVAMNADGVPQHPGDMAAQIAMTLDNLETVLTPTGFTFADVVRLNFYTTLRVMSLARGWRRLGAGLLAHSSASPASSSLN